MSDLARLFAEDPLKLTKPDLEEIIKGYRNARNLFNLGDKAAGNTKNVAPKEKGPKIATLDLGDIKL